MATSINASIAGSDTHETANPVAAQKAIDDVQKQYQNALDVAKPGWFSTDTEDYIYANLQKRGDFVKQWQSQLPEAEANNNLDGWVNTGKLLQEEFAYDAKVAPNAKLWDGIVKPATVATVEQTAKDVQAVGNSVIETASFLDKWKKPLIVAGLLVFVAVAALIYLPRRAVSR